MADGLFEKPLFRLAGDRGLLVEYGDTIDPEINRKIRAMAIAMDREKPAGLVEFIPTYRSIILIYDPSVTDPPKLKASLEGLERRIDDIEIHRPSGQ